MDTATLYPHLAKYERPRDFADFADFDRHAYYVIIGQHRNSDTLTRSNFRSLVALAGGESTRDDDVPMVLIVRDSHWAVGWIEALYVHEEADPAILARLDSTLASLEDYPVVDEMDWSDLQYSDADRYWAAMSIKERLYVCQRFELSPFAARHASIPDDPNGGLIEYLADGN